MQTIALEPTHNARLHVVVGVIRRNTHVLIQQRVSGKACAGQWEFPGGKVETGESPRYALQRELQEELGIEVLTAHEMMELPFDYAHARVWLEVFLVDSFISNAVGLEGQQISWLTPTQIRQLDLLAAVYPILDSLETLSDSGR